MSTIAVTRPDCAAYRAGLANPAELDRRARSRKLNDALVDSAEAQATAPVVAASGGVR